MPHRSSPGPHQASAETRRRQPDIRAPCSTAKTRPYWRDLPASLATHSRFSSRERRAQTAVQCVAYVAETEATSRQRCIPWVSQFPTGNNKGCGEMSTQNPGIRCTSLRPQQTRDVHPMPGWCWVIKPALVDRTVMNTWWLDTEKLHQLSRWKQRWRY